MAPHIQANEKGIYVLEGEIEMMRGQVAFHLVADDYAFIPYGETQAFRNKGKHAARWTEIQSPQPKPPGGWQDTFFAGKAAWPREVLGPDLTDPRTRYVGHFREERARKVVRGLTVYRFIEEELGAHHFYMMRGELAVGGIVGTHDHTVEETYFVLSGEVEMEIEGKRYPLQAGDLAWTGVGTSHGFYQRGEIAWRWIETQSPQFPAQHGKREYAAWDKLRRS
jgi:mannose-6-phosphate isomerase-like protein (cupin superfamily)